MPNVTHVNGVGLAWDERGEGTPVLFMHGTGTMRLVFEPTIAALPSGVRAINYDRRGFNDSRAEPVRDLQEHVDDAVALLRELEASPVILVAQSGGGPIALRLAVQHPNLVSALVLAEPAYQVALCRPSAAQVRAGLGLTYRRWIRCDNRAAALGYYRWATRYATGGNAFNKMPEDWRRRTTEPAHITATFHEIDQQLRPWPPAADVGGIACPVTLAIGDAGEPIFHRSTHRADRALSDAKLVAVPGGTSHLLFLDQPKAFADVVASAAATSQLAGPSLSSTH